MPEKEKPAKLKDLKDIEPPKKNPKQERLEKLVEKDPAAIAHLLKNWLGEE